MNVGSGIQTPYLKCGVGSGQLLMQMTEDSDWKVGKKTVNVSGNCKYNIGFIPRLSGVASPLNVSLEQPPNLLKLTKRWPDVLSCREKIGDW